VVQCQGGQIGRIFASWVIIYLGKFFFEDGKSSPNFWTASFRRKGYVLISTQNGLGYILGDFLQAHLVTLPV
jgi:hypothetical protein